MIPAPRLPVPALLNFVAPVRMPARCDLCASPLEARGHRHLVVQVAEEVAADIECVCDPCRLVMEHQGSDGRRRSVPTDVTYDPGHDPAAFARLAAPVSVLWVSIDGRGVTASYPGPAGLATAGVDDEAWAEMTELSPLAARLSPLTQGLLMVADEAWLVGIDRCHAISATMQPPAGRLATAVDTAGLDAAVADLRACQTAIPSTARM